MRAHSRACVRSIKSILSANNNLHYIPAHKYSRGDSTTFQPTELNVFVGKRESEQAMGAQHPQPVSVRPAGLYYRPTRTCYLVIQSVPALCRQRARLARDIVHPFLSLNQFRIGPQTYV